MPTPDADALRGLIERVRAAKGPDRDLDLRIKFTMAAIAIRGRMGPEETQTAFGGLYDEPESYTASLDSARALIARVLSGLSIESGRSGNGNPAWCDIWDPMRAPNGQAWPRRILHDSGHEPLACLAMMLTVLLAQTEGAPDAER